MGSDCCGEHTVVCILWRRLGLIERLDELELIGSNTTHGLDAESPVKYKPIPSASVSAAASRANSEPSDLLPAFRAWHLHHRRDSSSHGGRVDAREWCQQSGHRRR